MFGIPKKENNKVSPSGRAFMVCIGLILMLSIGFALTPMPKAKEIGLMAKMENDFIKDYGVANYRIVCDAKFCWASISTTTIATTTTKTVIDHLGQTRTITYTNPTATKSLSNYYFSKVRKVGINGLKGETELRSEILLKVKKELPKVLGKKTPNGNPKINKDKEKN